MASPRPATQPASDEARSRRASEEDEGGRPRVFRSRRMRLRLITARSTGRRRLSVRAARKGALAYFIMPFDVIGLSAR